ncbi:MAG: class I SAM-dependent methyltransferase [Verrucomicrobiota bacterium]
MARNESPIAGPFVDQLTELFDVSYFIDHASTDHTIKIVSEHSGSSSIRLFSLLSDGYPQSQLATFFSRFAFERDDADCVFFLDCDEFLPFADRQSFTKHMRKLRERDPDAVFWHWRNLAPQLFDGGDIFSGKFRSRRDLSDLGKISLFKSIWEKDRKFVVDQGYHSISSDVALNQVISELPILHIPIQSKSQAMFKFAQGSNRLILEKGLLKKKLGYHWVNIAEELATTNPTATYLTSLAVNYPSAPKGEVSDELDELEFDFRYVSSPYFEDGTYVAAQTRGLIMRNSSAPISGGFTVINERGDKILSEKDTGRQFDGGRPGSQSLASEVTISEINNSAGVDLELLADGQQAVFGHHDGIPDIHGVHQLYRLFFEPLFSLPTKVPTTAWVGHIPFMFTLFKTLRPRTYVELGVHNGASFIAACTAAAQYQTGTKLFGVDSWEGDEHAGLYEGDNLYKDLSLYVSQNFENGALIRSYFADARNEFVAGSIDLLHIDGLHTYEAVKEDFTTWIPAMSAAGVILFHDINVHDRGFGVHRLWDELKEDYYTIDFSHSFGLGVLFVDEHSKEANAFKVLSSNPGMWRFYTNLVASVGETVGERAAFFQSQSDVANLHQQLGSLSDSLVGEQQDKAQKLVQIESLNNEIRSLNNELELVRQQVALLGNDRDVAQGAVEEIRRSTSWRISSPIRFLGSLLGR